MEERTPEIAAEYLEHYKNVEYGMMPEWVWDMAIKVLEQDTCEDCISRQAVMDCIDGYSQMIIRPIELKEYIDKLPSVTPKETILDKIRAEIESIERYGTVNGRDIWLRTPEEIKKEVFNIIDKYKVKSEG